MYTSVYGNKMFHSLLGQVPKWWKRLSYKYRTTSGKSLNGMTVRNWKSLLFEGPLKKMEKYEENSFITNSSVSCIAGDLGPPWVCLTALWKAAKMPKIQVRKRVIFR